ncbi:MAG: hypothetical protein HY317_04050 [Acidobacteria bacterium]|nr:hypothetical protein [Acidobacteriota bacterium]
MRRGLDAAIGLLALDLLVILVTGAASPLALGGGTGSWGFAGRLTLLALAVVFRFRVLVPRERRANGGRLVLLLLLLPTLAQFQYGGGRINGDGVMYYVYVRSLWKDLDLDFTNEYTHYELIRRSDLAVPTKTGLRRSIFSIGPAVVWTPFFWLGEAVARTQTAVGADADLSGYGPCHRNAVALGSLLYGFATVLLVHALLRRHFTEGAALGAALLAWGATFLHWYMVQQPTMSHAVSAFGAALGLFLWERDREARRPWGYLVLGLALGLAMCLRWQNGVLLALPGLELLGRLRRAPRDLPRFALCGVLLLAATAVGAIPQMAAWKALYDEWVLRYPPHGTDFLRLDHPFVLETLFSSRHGLLSWTPAVWAAYLGFLPLVRRRPSLGWPLVVPLALMTYVNMCSGDWWAGGSFSNRRFDSLLPVFAFGFAAGLEWAHRRLRANPRAVLGLVAVPFVLWNVGLAEQTRRGFIPRDDTVEFPRLAGNTARVVSEAVGFPTTWPASLVFAWRHGRPPSQYDLLVGKYLFYRQNNMGGHVEVGVPGDDALLGEGWGPIETREGVAGRRVRGRARLFAPLDVPEELEIRFRAVSFEDVAEVRVEVNGRDAGRFAATRTWAEHRLRVPAVAWRRELNDVVLVAAPGVVVVDAADFGRILAGPGESRGFRER